MKKLYFGIFIFFVLVFSFKTLACAQCNQPIELQKPPSNQLYKIYPTTYIDYCGMCGNDKNDIIMDYSVVNGKVPSSPDVVKIWSDNWYVRWILSSLLKGQLSAEGLCSNSIRACAGYRVMYPLGGWTNSIYVWF